MIVNEHNRGEHLTVTYFWTPRNTGVWKYPPGWYVVRTCHCHYDKPVTMPFKSRQHAERVRDMLLAASEACGT